MAREDQVNLPPLKIAESRLVGWCSDHEAYTYPPEPQCPGDSLDGVRCHYRKRRMWVCLMGPTHCEGEAFFDREDLNLHLSEVR